VLVPEGRRVFPALTVGQNLRLGTWTKRHRRAELRTTEERVYEYFPILAERRDQMAGTLSGGQQQMLAIGRGLMGLPRLMLIDEASLGLSPALAKTVFSIVDSLTYNFPEFKRVRFLVGGEERETLQSHLDLRRAWLKDMSIVRMDDAR